MNNFTDQPYALKRGSDIANFSVMTPEQMKYVKPIDAVTAWHLLQNNPENAAYYASSLIKSTRTGEDQENYWFPTPEEPGDPQLYTPIQQRILKELQNLQEQEKLTLRMTLSLETNTLLILTGQTLRCSQLKSPKLKSYLSNFMTYLRDTDLM